MRRYLDNAIIFDFIISILLGVGLFYGKSIIRIFINLPSTSSVSNFEVSLITVSATLIGFLLTIITVVVTFKKGFEDENVNELNNFKEDSDIPGKTIFDKKITKETKFYGTEIHKKVVNVFVKATYEISIILFILLILQFNVIKLPIAWNSIFSCCSFILLVLSVVRCLYIFQLFLNVHLHNKTIN
jgi:hypothetical protein